MALNSYKPGQCVHFPVTDTVIAQLTDPSLLVLTIHPPTGPNVIPTVTRASTGIYYADYVLPMNAPVGLWSYRWQATGLPPAMNGLVEDAFNVVALDF